MIKVGDRIKVLQLAINPATSKPDPGWKKTIHPGDLGTITSISNIQGLSTAQIWVQFDSGSKIALLEGIDSFEIITEE